MASSPKTYGYDANFEPPLKKRLECPICLLGQKDPLQTPCGHRFCGNCIDNALRMTGPRCPIDNKPLSITQLFPDNFARREVLSLTVLCNNSKPGCVWKGELRELEDHLTVCQLAEIQCPFGCGSKFTRGHFYTHQSECEKKPSRCPQCDIVYPNDLIEEHQPFCSRTKPQSYIRQILGQHKLLRWTGYIQLGSPSTFQAHFISFDSQEINTSFWPCNLKFTLQSGTKECDQSLDLGKKMNQIMKVDFVTETNQSMEDFFVEKMFYVCRISYSKRKKNYLILQLVWNTEKKECVLCVFKDSHIKYLTKKMENRNLMGMPEMIRAPPINHSRPTQMWPPVAGISVNSALPRINVAPEILLPQAPSLPSVVPTGNPPVITQPVWSPFVVYPSLLSAYVGTPNILTYSQLNTSPINFPSTYMDTASYFIIDGQNSNPTSIMHTHTNPAEPVEELFNIHDDELAQNAEAVWLLNNLNESPERIENQFSSTGSGRMRTRRSTSNRIEPYGIPERFQGSRATAYPLPHLSDTSSPHISFSLPTIVPSVSAAVVYPNSLSLPQQFVPGGVPPPVPSIIFTSLENATSNIIGNANITMTDPVPHAQPQPIPIQAAAEYPSVAVVHGDLTTAISDAQPHVPAIIPANTLIPPLSMHADSLRNRAVWDQGFMPIHISASQNQTLN